MDKEKEIQEMARIVCPYDCYRTNEVCDNSECDFDCEIIAQNLYNAGYRKQENVAIEILSKVGEMFVADYEGNEHQIKELPWFRVLCRDYKVEL